MRPKYKVTGCARFFLFLVIFIPIVFFGAAYIRGENGVQIIKDFYHQVIGGKDKPAPHSQNENEPNLNAKPESKAGEKSGDQYELEVLKEELRKTEKEYHAQLEQIRKENKDNNAAMYREIRDFLGAQMAEMKEGSESAVRNDNDEHFERLRQSMESVFTDELQKKTAELEQMKVFSEAQANKLIEDTHEKNQRIDFLEEKIKEIAQKLPEEAQQELYEELGFELPKVLEELDDKPKHQKKKKGLFDRLSAALE